MEVKALLFKFHTIKRASKAFQPGEYAVRIRISQLKEKAFISLGYSSSIENWDNECWIPRPSHPHYKNLLVKINNYLDDIFFEVKLAEKAAHSISCIEVKRRVLHRSSNLCPKRSQLKILEFFDKVIADLEATGKPGYADTFQATRSTVSRLINGNDFIPPSKKSKQKDKAFLAFTMEDHLRYEKLISNGTSESTISIYLRTYYRIWNMAIKEGYCTREAHHPSRYIKFKPYKRIRTKKRSMSQEYLKKIMDLEYDPKSRLFRSQLLLQFIYYGRGINFGDMCKLKWKNFANGTVHYTRSKNHREYDYILHPKAVEVANYFKNHSVQSDAGYILPILFLIHDTPRKIDQRIESALKEFNADLKKMAATVGWERKFTSYSLRHSFATHLRNNDVSISIIQEALGHELEKQTAVYLDELDDQHVANEITRALDFGTQKCLHIKRP